MLSEKPVIAAAGVVLTLFALAGNAQEPSERPEQQPHSMNQMSMQMMHECMNHCQAMSGSMQELRSTVEQARESNDPAQMRAALDQVQKHMSGMEGKMGGCMMKGGRHGQMDHSPDQSEEQQ